MAPVLLAAEAERVLAPVLLAAETERVLAPVPVRVSVRAPELLRDQAFFFQPGQGAEREPPEVRQAEPERRECSAG